MFLIFKFQMEQTLYDPSLLRQLNFKKSIANFKPEIDAIDTGETWIRVRPLQDGDYERGFLQLLSQLTDVGHVTKAEFLSKINDKHTLNKIR